MHPILIQIGPLTVYSWGFMVALGFLAGLFTATRYAERENISPDLIYDLFIRVVIGAIVGARLCYVIAFPSGYIKDPLSIFYLNQGGMVFLGGFIGVVLLMIPFIRRNKLNVWKILDILSPATMIGYCIGRIGCFLNGCCYGIEFCGVVQPTQIYSSLAGLIIFLILVRLYPKKKYDGQIFLIASCLYSAYRFLLEFVRYNPVHVYIFTPNQLLLAALFAVILISLWKKNST
jgi:phosphatidylglycerol---prolipoprotein diacylglyceryl transferase